MNLLKSTAMLKNGKDGVLKIQVTYVWQNVL